MCRYNLVSVSSICWSFNQWCSGAVVHGNGVLTREMLRYIFIIAIKFAIFPCYHVTTFLRTPHSMSKLDFRICKVLAHYN